MFRFSEAGINLHFTENRAPKRLNHLPNVTQLGSGEPPLKSWSVRPHACVFCVVHKQKDLSAEETIAGMRTGNYSRCPGKNIPTYRKVLEEFILSKVLRRCTGAKSQRIKKMLWRMVVLRFPLCI